MGLADVQWQSEAFHRPCNTYAKLWKTVKLAMIPEGSNCIAGGKHENEAITKPREGNMSFRCSALDHLLEFCSWHLSLCNAADEHRASTDLLVCMVCTGWRAAGKAGESAAVNVKVPQAFLGGGQYCW